MAIDPFTASKRLRSSNEDENSDKGKPQGKKKENSSKDVPGVVSDRDYDTEPEKDENMITVDKWKDLFKSLRKVIKGLIAREDFMQTMAYIRMGMKRTLKLSRQNNSRTWSNGPK
jgi:hypothetical protein